MRLGRSASPAHFWVFGTASPRADLCKPPAALEARRPFRTGNSIFEAKREFIALGFASAVHAGFVMYEGIRRELRLDDPGSAWIRSSPCAQGISQSSSEDLQAWLYTKATKREIVPVATELVRLMPRATSRTLGYRTGAYRETHHLIAPPSRGGSCRQLRRTNVHFVSWTPVDGLKALLGCQMNGKYGGALPLSRSILITCI